MNPFPPYLIARQACTLHVRSRKENSELNPLKIIGQTVFFNLGAASSLRNPNSKSVGQITMSAIYVVPPTIV